MVANLLESLLFTLGDKKREEIDVPHVSSFRQSRA